MAEPIKCELHLGDAVYQLDEFMLYRDHTEIAGCSNPSAPPQRIYHGPRMISAVIGDKIEE